MKSEAAIQRILTLLDELYPWDGACFLCHREPWQLLFATILSAQCTDDRVNKVTEVLFKKYPSLESFSKADIHELEKDVRPTGFFRVKALHIKESAGLLLEKYGGRLPSGMEALTSLPGVGRKTANVARSHIFQIPCIVVDTHVKRITNRLGITDETDPEKIEYALMEILPESHWIRYNQQVITHGRAVCKAQNPRCPECGFTGDCDYIKKSGGSFE